MTDVTRMIYGTATPTDRPRFADEWSELAAVAADLLKGREAGYPALVAGGRLEAHQAETGLRIMRAIAADWQRLAARFEPRAPDAPAALRSEREATLVQALERCRGLAAKGRMQPDYALCVEAMIWHERHHGGPGALADTNIALRASLAAPRQAAA